MLYLANRFHVAVRLFSNRSQMTSKCGKNISDTLGYASCATFLFLHFDVICDVLLNRRTATWNRVVNLSPEQFCEPKNFDVALKIAGFEKYPRKTCGCGQPRGLLIRLLNELKGT